MADNSLVNQALLDSLNIEQARDENRAVLDNLGGIERFITMVGVDPHTGWSHSQVLSQREKFGDNTFPESPMDSYLELLVGALSDPTLLILTAAAAVSLVIGVITEPEHGWIEGSAIFIAIFLVSNISAGNDYSKQLQFKALEASSAKDERTSVLRDGVIERINPKDIVVGDVLVLQVSFAFPFMPPVLSINHRPLPNFAFCYFDNVFLPSLRRETPSLRTPSLLVKSRRWRTSPP